jgi:hypothetical protein
VHLCFLWEFMRAWHFTIYDFEIRLV